MKDKSNIKATSLWKRVLILLTTVMFALALCVTCVLVFDGDKAVKVPVDEVTDGEVSTSATTYTNRASGSLVGVVNNGDVLNITVTGQNVRNYTLPQGTYRFDLYGGQGGGCGNDNGGKGGRMYVTYNVTASSQLFYFSVGGKGTNATSSIDGGYDSTRYAGGVNGGGNGSGRGGPGGGGGTDIRTGGSGTGNRVVVAAGGGGGLSSNTAYTQAFSSSGVLYQGASGCSSRHSSSFSNDEGGGGGGYYGGAVRHGDDPRGSYSGSNYAASGYSVSTNALGQNSGNGKIIITVVSVNTAPTSKNYTYNNTSSTASVNTYRGTGKAINIGVTTIASDASGQTLYYTTGTGTDSAPATNSTNTYLYTNSTGTTLATTYIDWKWTSSTNLQITAIKRYPSGGKLTLYARVRDNYGSSASMRASALIPFYITVNNYGITVKNTTSTPTRYTGKGTAPNTYEYRLGMSNNTSTTTDFIANTNAVYGTNTTTPTVFVPQPLTTGHPGFTINAADLFQTADSTYDTVGIKSVASSSYTTYYSITYNSGVAGIYSSITIKPTNARPTSAIFVTVQITAQEYEKATNTALSSTNTQLYLTFKIANTRPYFASNTLWNSGNTAEPYIELNVGQSIDLSITSFLYDPDGTTPTFVTSGAANSFIKVPTNEYICVTRDNSVIGLKSGTNYNRGSTVPTTWQSGEGNTATGFSAATLAANGSTAASTACVTYSYPNNKTLRLTGRAATQYQYSGTGRKGDFYILVRVSDPGESTDAGIWYPVAVKVKNSAPKEPSTTASFDLSFAAPVGEAAPVGNPIYLTPISYTDASGTLRGIGTIDSNTTEQAEQQVRPFVTDIDVFSYATSNQHKSKLNDIITINGTTEAAALILNNTQQFFKVELWDLYASKEVFDNYLKLNRSNNNLSGDGRIEKQSDAVYKFKGLKVTPLRSTGDYYYEIGVKTVDSLGGTNDNVRVFFKVANTTVNARSASSTNYPFNIESSHGAVVTNTTDYDINYTIEKSDVIYITPYDLAYDFDTQYASLNNVSGSTFNFNTNPYDSGFAQAVSAINATYSVKRLASVGSSSIQAQTASVPVQQLSFGGREAFESAVAQYTAYFNAEMVTSVTVGGSSYNIPAIKITANGRTSANLPVLRLTITDGYSSVTVNVAVTVRNAAPKLKTVGGSLHSIIAGTPPAGSGLRNSRDFDIGTYVEDIDNDTPSFVAGTVRVVAKVGNTGTSDDYTSLLNAAFEKADLVSAVYNLEDYIYAVLTKDNYGNDIIRITALSSTQLFPVPIYLEFQVNDGYRADPQQPTLRIPVEVINSDPEFLTSDLTERDSGGYGWFVKVENMPEKALPRYIVNCPELYNSSTAISAAPANKMLLFADADAKQRVLLNPAAGLPTSTNEQLIANLTQVHTSGAISAETFAFDTYKNAAVLYTPTYESASKNTLDVSVIFYKEENGRIRALSSTEGTSDMWAIMIVDRTNTNDNGNATQISIAVSDNHHKADIYSQGEKTGEGDSAVTVIDFYYQYQQLGITAMHEYYRTDGNAEASTAIVGVDGTATGEFNVSYDKLYAYQFEDETKPTIADGETAQQTVAHAHFSDDFKYQYFVNTTTKVIDGVDTAVMAPKTYATNKGNAFYYKPIEVAGGTEGAANTATLMPISYIAMPSIYNLTEGTENSTHVTFANVGGSSVLKDGAYLDWGATTNKSGDSTLHDSAWASATLKAVFENLSLSDGIETWSGALPTSDPMYITKNPYIDIKYIASIDLADFGLTSGNTDSLINQFRANLTDSGDYSYSNDWKDVNGASKFREDRFGFSFTKKKRVDGDSQTGKRFAGSLKFTVNLKTNEEDAAAQPVSVDIKLRDSEPTSFKFGGQQNEATNIIEFSTSLTTANASGVTFKLVYGDPGTNEIGYRDPDTTDEARFFMPSASNQSLGALKTAGGITEAELDHILLSSRRSNYTTANTIEALEAFTPNPGYERFFSISPTGGTSTSLQIVPQAKTALNIPSDAASRSEFLTANNLREDSDGVYYPFRVLIYDDLDDTGFTNGFYMPVLVKVYIQNDPLKFTGSATYGEGDHARAGKYEFTLVKGIAQSVDVSSFLADNDMVMNGQSFAVVPTGHNPSGGDKNVLNNQALVKDYLVMPAANDYEVLKGGTKENLPIQVTNSASSSIITFNAQSAFKNEIDLLFKFRDSDPNVTRDVEVVIRVKYTNERPFENVDTFGGAATFNIVMKTNDFFTLHVADASLFGTDKIGLFNSPDAFESHVTSYPANDHSSPDNDSAYMSAAQLKNSFKQYTTTTYPTSDSSAQPIINVGNLGDLVVGGDDAPSTLRFLTNATGKPVGTFSSNADLFDVSIVSGSRLPTEEVLSRTNPTYSPNTDSPMSIKVTAKGVIDNVKYVVTLYDHAGVRKDVTFNITVLSTAPTLAVGTEHNFPNRLTVSQGTAEYRYSTTLRYGESIDFALSALVSDIDRGDSSRLVIPDAYDGAKFKIEHKSGVAAVAAESVTRVGVDYIRITATDFIPVQGEDGYSKVTFRVADPHGVQSDEITIAVFVYPQDMTSSASTVGEKRTLTLGSYADFAESGERTEYNLIAPATSATTLFVDPDYNSLSALYSVTVYALYDVEEDGTVRGITASQLDFDNYYDSHIILRRIQAMGSTEAETPECEGDVFDYVSKFFTMEISDDGRIITFTPVSATIPGDNNGRTVTPLNLYVRVAKSYTRTTASGSEYTLDPVGAYLDVSVANSTPVAVQNSAINYGYPQVEAGVARVSDFLSFTGSAGDELTWDLYNTNPQRDENFGLFYDYDKINNPTGNESLTYSGFSVLSHYEYGSGEGKLVIDTARDAITPEIASTGPVLSVTETQGKVTIKINRKVRIAQPTTAAPALPYSYIPVEISCYDTLGARATAATRTVAKTVIIVRVQNDAPDFKAVADQDNRLGYRISYNESTGEYDLTATVKTGDRLTLNYRDIIDDADFNMDAYFFSSKSSIKSDTTTIGNSDDDNLFSFAVGTPSNNSYGISTVSSISFTCLSNKRGEVARSTLVLCDSTMQETASKLNIILTVGNTKPTLKSSDPITINLMGRTKNPPEGVSEDDWNSNENPAATFNILEFMTDINPNDAIDMDTYPDINAEGRPYTYMYIENIVVYTTESETNKPLLTGPAAVSGNDKGEPYSQACMVNWSSRENDSAYNYSHQNFDIILSPGLYGTQKVTLTVTDSGYLDGAMNYVDDGESEDITITIVISRPIEEIEAPTFDIANRVTRRITPELLLNNEDEPHNADGYVITSITTPENSPIEVIETPAAAQASANGVSTSAAGSTWAIRAMYKQADATITVVFNDDPEHNSKTFNINILDNNAPIMRDIENMGIFSTAELNEKFMITITPERWFTDPDVEDVMSFKSATVKVSAYAEAHLDGRNIVLLFKGRGTTDLTLEIQDLSGTVYNHTIQIGCSDMAQLSAWNALVASIQSNVLLYALIAGGVLLLIILLIIILVVVHKKRKMRREIEALLDSEAELEEEMLRLSSAGMSPYQSYGYLPPTTPTMNDPGLMLGSAQGNPTPNSLQLGAGTGQTTGAAPTPPVLPTQPVTQNIPVTGAPQQQPPQNGDGFDPNSF